MLRLSHYTKITVNDVFVFHALVGDVLPAFVSADVPVSAGAGNQGHVGDRAYNNYNF